MYNVCKSGQDERKGKTLWNKHFKPSLVVSAFIRELYSWRQQGAKKSVSSIAIGTNDRWEKNGIFAALKRRPIMCNSSAVCLVSLGTWS